MQLPPPVHGASIVNKNIKDSEKINKEFSCTFLNISLAKSLENLGGWSIKKGASFIILLLNILRQLFVNKYDAIYITLSPHGGAFYKDSIILFISKLFCKNRVIHLHGKGIKAEISKNKIKRFFYNFVFSKCNVFHLSEILVSDIGDLVNRDNIHIVPNGIRDNLMHRTQYGADNPIILYISNLVPSKGALDFLKACDILKKEKLPFRAFLAGDSPSKSFLNSCQAFIKEKDLDKDVELLGPVYGDKKQELLLSSDVFILPTYFKNECFPLSILEAMSYSLPIVSTDEGAISELVKNDFNGYLCDKQSPESIARCLKKLLLDRNKISKLGKNSYLHYSKNYTLDCFENNFIQAIKAVI